MTPKERIRGWKGIRRTDLRYCCWVVASHSGAWLAQTLKCRVLIPSSNALVPVVNVGLGQESGLKTRAPMTSFPFSCTTLKFDDFPLKSFDRGYNQQQGVFNGRRFWLPARGPAKSTHPLLKNTEILSGVRYYLSGYWCVTESTNNGINAVYCLFAPYASWPPTNLAWTHSSGSKRSVGVKCDNKQVPPPTQFPTEEPTELPTQEPTSEPTTPTLVPTRSPNLCNDDPVGKALLVKSPRPPENVTWFLGNTTSASGRLCRLTWTCSKTEFPSEEPTYNPTEEPSEQPSQEPTEEPSAGPSQEPTQQPSEEPSQEPSEEPSKAPTDQCRYIHIKYIFGAQAIQSIFGTYHNANVRVNGHQSWTLDGKSGSVRLSQNAQGKWVLEGGSKNVKGEYVGNALLEPRLPPTGSNTNWSFSSPGKISAVINLECTNTDLPTTEPTQEPTEEPTVSPTQQPSQQPTVLPSEEPTEEPTITRVRNVFTPLPLSEIEE